MYCRFQPPYFLEEESSNDRDGHIWNFKDHFYRPWTPTILFKMNWVWVLMSSIFQTMDSVGSNNLFELRFPPSDGKRFRTFEFVVSKTQFWIHFLKNSKRKCFPGPHHRSLLNFIRDIFYDMKLIFCFNHIYYNKRS